MEKQKKVSKIEILFTLPFILDLHFTCSPQFIEAAPKPMDAVSAALHGHRKRAKRLAKLAEDEMHSRAGTIEFLKIENAAFYFYLSAISFKCCARWRDAGSSLIRCAEVHQANKFFVEAAILYCEAADVLNKVDKAVATRSTKRAISIYCDMGRFDIAGRLERSLAVIEFQLGHWEEALAHYKKASNFLWGEMLLDSADASLQKVAEC